MHNVRVRRHGERQPGSGGDAGRHLPRTGELPARGGAGAQLPGPGEALVKVEAVGICASDLKCYHGAAKFWGDENRPAWAETEVIPGHEFVGTVVQLDDEAAERWGIAVGDRVVAEQIVPCWKCRYCLRGQYWMCAPHDMFGFKRRTPGAMAEYMVYPPDALVHKVSADLPPAHAAFAEPLSCALHAVERAGITFDDVVVVAGCGPIGLGMIAGAKAKNPALVVALDLAPEKLELAKECGADMVDQHRARRTRSRRSRSSPTATAPTSTSRAPATPRRSARG